MDIISFATLVGALAVGNFLGLWLFSKITTPKKRVR